MLVISRKHQQRILIADGLIRLTIVRIDRDKVRIGIEAPKDINILREELVEQTSSQVNFRKEVEKPCAD